MKFSSTLPGQYLTLSQGFLANYQYVESENSQYVLMKNGHAGGFTKKELESGGSLYSFVTTGEFDNTEDSTYVRYGYDLYNNVIKDYDYIHISQ